MRRSIVCGFIFTALLQIAVCDIDCFLQQDLVNVVKIWPTLQNGLGFTVSLCRPVREYLEATAKAAKDCKLKKIDLTKGLAFTKDLCTVGWDLNNRYLDQENCFAQQLGNIGECGKTFKNVTLPSLASYSSTDGNPVAAWKTVLKEACKEFDDVYKCFIEKMGNPCKDEGTALTKELTTAMSSYTKGLCLEVNGATTINVLSWSMLLVLLVVVLNWHKN